MTICFQIKGNYYMSVDQVGSGSRWRRTTGQEIYSPLLLAFTHEVCLPNIQKRCIVTKGGKLDSSGGSDNGSKWIQVKTGNYWYVLG